MSPQEQEITKLHDDIVQELRGILEHNEKVFDWDIPENDDQAASKMILDVMQEALETLRQENGIA